MRAPLVLAALLAASFAATQPVFAADAAASGAPRLEEKKSELGELMSKMGRHFKALKKNVTSADKKEANVKDFKAIAELAGKSKAHVPETAKTDDDKKLYAEMMDKVAAAAKDGAKASEDGKVDDAKKAFDDLKKLMGEGHKKFNPEDK